MDNLLACEARYREHDDTVASINREGWQAPTRATRRYRAAVAKALIALATRMMPPAPAIAFRPES